MSYMKNNLPFLYDDETHGLIGVRDADTGAETLLATVQRDPVTGGITGLVGPGGAIIISHRSVASYGVRADGVYLTDVSTNNSATCTVQSASGAFKSSDVGKVCAVHTRASTTALANSRYGTITAVASATQCTATLNSAPGVLTNALFVYGSDDSLALQDALDTTALSPDKVVHLPAGIICVSTRIVVPAGLTLIGAGREYTEKEWYDFHYTGSSIVQCGWYSGPTMELGDATGAYGPSIYSFNIDGMGSTVTVVYSGNRANKIEDITALKPNGTGVNSHAIKMGSGSVVLHSTFIGGYNCHTVAVNGDAQFCHNVVYGAGTNRYAIKCSTAGDIIIANNHMWAPGNGLFNAGSILVEAWETATYMHSVQISGNEFDTAQNMPHILVDVQANATLRGLSIVGNNSFNNNSVDTPYPWLDLNVASGASLRGLVVQGNNVVGSWADPTQGMHTCLIDGAGIVGSVMGSTIMGNSIDRPTVGGYTSFTPDHSSGNVRIAAGGAVTVF